MASGQLIPVDSFASVEVKLNGKTLSNLRLYVAEGIPSLFGRHWIIQFLGENWFEKLLLTEENCLESCQMYAGRGPKSMLADGDSVQNG